MSHANDQDASNADTNRRISKKKHTGVPFQTKASQTFKLLADAINDNQVTHAENNQFVNKRIDGLGESVGSVRQEVGQVRVCFSNRMGGLEDKVQKLQELLVQILQNGYPAGQIVSTTSRRAAHSSGVQQQRYSTIKDKHVPAAKKQCTRTTKKHRMPAILPSGRQLESPLAPRVIFEEENEVDSLPKIDKDCFESQNETIMICLPAIFEEEEQDVQGVQGFSTPACHEIAQVRRSTRERRPVFVPTNRGPAWVQGRDINYLWRPCYDCIATPLHGTGRCGKHITDGDDYQDCWAAIGGRPDWL